MIGMAVRHSLQGCIVLYRWVRYCTVLATLPIRLTISHHHLLLLFNNNRSAPQRTAPHRKTVGTVAAYLESPPLTLHPSALHRLASSSPFHPIPSPLPNSLRPHPLSRRYPSNPVVAFCPSGLSLDLLGLLCGIPSH